MTCVICNRKKYRTSRFCSTHYREDLQVRKTQIKRCIRCGKVLTLKMRNITCKPCSHNIACEKYRSIRNNMEKIRKKNAEYKKNNKEKIQEHNRMRYNIDPIYRIKRNLRHRLNVVLTKSIKKGSAISDLGCDINTLRSHIEKQFQPGMSWENYNSKTWHIDHIQPLCSFDLSDPEQLKKACHYTNLRPLWAKDNLKKISIDIKQSIRRKCDDFGTID